MKRFISSLVALVMLLSILARPVSAAGNSIVKDAVSLTLDSVEAEPDTDVNISLKINGAYTATALTVFVDYDPSLLANKGALQKGNVWYSILDVDGMVQTSVNTPGRIGFMAIVADGDFSDTGTIFTIKFHVSANAQAGTTISLTLTVDQFTYDEISGNVIPINYTATDGAVIIPGEPDPTTPPASDPVELVLQTVEADPDTDVNVSLTIDGAYTATALTVFVDYDPSLLTNKGALQKGNVWHSILDVDGMVQTSVNTPGRIGFMAIVADGDFSDTGTIFTIKFHVSADAEPGTIIPLTLTVDQFTYDEISGNVIPVPYNATNGAVSINEAEPEFHTITYTINGEFYASVEYQVGLPVSAPEYTVPEGYTFSGWDVPDAMPAQDITLDATLEINKYTVTWKNWNGTVLETDNNVPYGTTPTYDGATPTRPSTAQYTYTFSGWTPAVTPVTGNTVYTATFTETLRTYTVTWKNWDGTVLETDNNVPYGTTPSYDGSTPTRPATAQYTYTFSGWTPAVSAVAGNAVYTATYTDTVNAYTVTWKNWDGTVLETDIDVPYGTTPTYNGATPSRPATAQYTYTFTGWTPAIAAVTGNTVYTATYSTAVNTYTVTWKNWDGTVLETDTSVPYGTTPTYNGATPTKPATDQETYTFAGWTPEVSPVVGNIVYTAVFSSSTNKYTITWVNWDGTVLETDYDVPYGTTPSYDGATPQRPSTAQYSYSFAGWTPNVTSVTGNATYTATYTETLNTYTVTWKNWNGSILETDSNVPYGTMPSYNGTTPTRPATAQYSYSFAGWSPEIAAVTGNAVYTATYSETINTYTVIWKNWDGTVLETDTGVPYGTMPAYNGATPVRPSTAQYTYTFSSWTPAVSSVTGNATYTAAFTETVNTYTVTWKNWDGAVLEVDSNVPFGSTPTYNGATPVKEGSAQYSYTFSGWNPEIAAVSGDAVYTAVFTEVLNTYTVTWKNWNGTVLETDSNVPYGTTPTYNGATPTRPSTVQYTYTFSGWTPTVAPVTGNAVYTATFTETLRTYTVTWKNWDGTVLETDNDAPYGATPTYDGATPTRPATAQYSYTFNGWTPDVTAVTGNAVYTATYTETVNTYTVTWKNWDGTVLETDTNVPYGTTPAYDGAEPTKPSTAENYYVFVGWTPNIVPVSGNADYTAVFEEHVRSYTITYTINGETYTTQTYEVGAAVVAPDYTIPEGYTFSGWQTPATMPAENVTLDATLTINTYTVTFVDGLTGEVISEVVVEYGGAAEAPDAPEHAWYAFNGWDCDFSNVTSDITVTATYLMLGDVDGDGQVTVADALVTLRYAMGLINEIDFNSADADNDGTITIFDALLILRHALGLI